MSLGAGESHDKDSAEKVESVARGKAVKIRNILSFPFWRMLIYTHLGNCTLSSNNEEMAISLDPGRNCVGESPHSLLLYLPWLWKRRRKRFPPHSKPNTSRCAHPHPTPQRKTGRATCFRGRNK